MMEKIYRLNFCQWTKPDFKCMFLLSHVTMATTHTLSYLSKYDSLSFQLMSGKILLWTKDHRFLKKWPMQCRDQRLCLATLTLSDEGFKHTRQDRTVVWIEVHLEGCSTCWILMRYNDFVRFPFSSDVWKLSIYAKIDLRGIWVTVKERLRFMRENTAANTFTPRSGFTHENKNLQFPATLICKFYWMPRPPFGELKHIRQL